MSVATGGLSRGLSSAGKSVTSFGSSVRAKASSIVTSFAKIGLAIQGVQTIAKGIAAAVTGPLSLAASAEQTAVSFTTLLGSAEESQKVMSGLRDFAATTPFQFPEIADSAKSLVAFGVSTEDLTPTLKALGDVAAGLNIPFGELSEIYGKAKVQGRLFMEDINQLAGRGIPIQEELAKQFGVTGEEVRELVSSGEVNFSHLEKAFQSLTGEGGKFAGLMEAQSQTMSGLWSTLKDNVGIVLTELGQTIIDTFDLKGSTANITSFIQNVRPQITAFLEKVKAGLNAVKPIIIQLWNVMKARWKMIAEQVTWAWNQIKGAWEGIGFPSFEQIRAFILDALIAAEFAFLNWKSVAELSLKSVALGIVTLAGEVKHTFTVVIPSLLKFLWENWREILHDIGELAITTFKNLASNIVKIIKNIPKLIKGDVSFSDLWTPLTEGAEFQLKKLPDIPPRVMSDMEKALRKDVGGLREKLKGDFSKFREDRLKDLMPPPEVKKAMDEVKNKAKEVSEAVKESIPKELKDRAKKVIESTRTPLEQFKQEFTELRELFDKGLIDKDTFNRAVTNALPDKVADIIERTKTPMQKFQEGLKELEDFKAAGLIDPKQFETAVADLKKDIFKDASKPQLASAAEFGSQEARQAIVRNRLGGNRDPLKDLHKTEQQALAVQQQQLPLLRKIANKEAEVLVF